MKTFADFQNQIKNVLQDAAGKLPIAASDAAILQAILQRYSKDRPQEKVTDVPGDGTSDIALPAGYEDGFSILRSLEYPIGNVPPTYLEDDEWMFYRSPTGLKIRLLSTKPTATQNVRVSWTARHAADGTTVPDWDFEAVCDFAGSLGFEGLAGVYAQTGDPTIQADVVNYRTKAQEYLGLAKAARRRYFNHLGIEEGASGGAAAGPAISMGDLNEAMGSGVDRLTHPKPR